MKAFYTVFDRDNNRIGSFDISFSFGSSLGFVRAKSDPNLIPEVDQSTGPPKFTSEDLSSSEPPPQEKSERNNKFFKNDVSENVREEPRIFKKSKENLKGSSKEEIPALEDGAIPTPNYEERGTFSHNNGAIKNSGVQYLNILPEWQTSLNE